MQETANFLNDSAATLAAEGLHDEAIACLKKGLLLEPENATLWFNLGLSYRALKKSKESTMALCEAAKRDPLDADIWDTLGISFFETGDYEESKKSYHIALEIEPNNGRIWNNYGTLLFNQEDFEAARNAFESAIALSPNMYDAVFNLRDTYLELGNKEQAKLCDNLLKKMESELKK